MQHITTREIVGAVAIVLAAGLVMGVWISNDGRKTCADYSSFDDAYKDFVSNPVKYKHLDRGGLPNVPCESLMK